MPSYPDSVKSFVSKVSGGNIDPAHVNDLQDEVNAVEAGLLNGTARLNSSGSTLGSLSVTGGSTLATLNVTGGSTFSVRPTAPPPDMALVFLDSTVTIGSSLASTVRWLAQDVAINSSIHSTATNPERLTPQSTGLYLAEAQLTIAFNSTGFRLIDLIDSSANAFARCLASSGVDGHTLNVSGYKRFDVTGGYVSARLELPAGVSTLSLSSAVGLSWMSLVKL